MKQYQQHNREVTWIVIARELWVRFGPPVGINFNEALKKLHQTGSLVEYQKEFETFGNLVDWSDDALLSAFLGGLQPELVEAVRMFEPQSLYRALSLTKIKDEQLQRLGMSTRVATG